MYKMGPKNFLLPTLLLSLALLSGAVHGETLDLAVTPETAPSRLLAEAIPGNSTDRTWRLTGPPGRRLHLICTDLTLLKFQSAECFDGFLSISENGAEEQKICERDSVYSRESVGNQLTVRIRTVPSSSGGRVSCAVLLVNGTVSGGSVTESAVTDTGEYLDGLGQHHTDTPDGGTDRKRLVMGSTTQGNEYPFMAAIVTSQDMARCGGTILTIRHILTAARCLDGYNGHDLRVVVGAPNLNGWGESSSTSIPSTVLKYGLPSVADMNKCRTYRPNKVYLNKICFVGDTGQACKSDRGGPLLMSAPNTYYVQVGLMTDEASCEPHRAGQPRAHRLHTALLPYVSTIEDIVRRTVPGLTCQRFRQFIPLV